MKNIKTDRSKILLVGIGNCGRGDDGLGWKFAELVKSTDHESIDIEYRYQLQIEDADLISQYDFVIFVDASQALLPDGFEVKPCTPAGHYFYSSHMQSPETILYLANLLYNKYPETYIIGITGYYWELKTSLSKESEKNLESAYNYFVNYFSKVFEHQLRRMHSLENDNSI
jgi:hydrogenase maturation protease